MGSRWARALFEHPEARLLVVSDIREDRGREAAERWRARYVADPLEAAAWPDVQGVAVCTPEHLHVEPALAAIEGSKGVMVEKPLADTVAGAERVRDRAHAVGVPILAGHILRFELRYAAVARALQAGEIGAVSAIHNERVGLVSDQAILQGRTSLALYYGVHEFDIARWYAGDVERIAAERSEGVLRARGFDVDDLFSAVLRFTNGAHGTATVGWSLPEATSSWGRAGVTVIGERGLLRVDQGELGFLELTDAGPRHVDVHYSPDVHGRVYGALAIEAAHFVDCLHGRAEPLCTANDGVEAVRISLAMEESARSGAHVTL
jgi:UDP-N-acetylglucosamine 3-dehydrogenase